MDITPKNTRRVMFVYYKIHPTERASLEILVPKFFKALQDRWRDLEVTFMQREESTNGMQTWMEIFKHPTGLSAEMMFDIGQKSKIFKMPGDRICEVFIDVTDSKAG